MLGGGGGGVVGKGGYSKRISLNKNPNVNKKNVVGGRGGNAGMGAGEVGAGESFFLYEPKFKIIPGGWKRRGWDMARVSDCFLFLNNPSVKKTYFFFLLEGMKVREVWLV